MISSTKIGVTHPLYRLFLGITVLLAGCASPQFIALPTAGTNIIQGGKMAHSQQKEGIGVSVRQAHTPYRLDRKITTLYITLINSTAEKIEFIPNDFLLFDQDGRQFFAMSKQDLAEAVSYNYYRTTFWGRNRYDPSHYYYHRPPKPVIDRRSYLGLQTQALPMGPIRIFPHATVGGNLYFEVPPEYLRSFSLRITRLSQIPEEGTTPYEIPYTFDFAVID